MAAIASREIRLAARPVGLPTDATFELGTADAPDPGDGEVQVKNAWMSVDPYMRGRMIDVKSYVPPFQVGQALEGGAVGEVVASKADGFKPGDLVLSMNGWREAWTGPAKGLQKIDPRGLPPQAFLGVVGMPGMTAWGGLLHVGRPKEGETVFVSAAAGAVGSIVCQIAKAKGCRVVGSAGGPDKIKYLKSIGCDATVDYKQHRGARALTKALAEAAPEGIDVYFENVGGDHLFAALQCLNMRGRVAVCGMISQYNDSEPQPGPSNLTQIIGKRLRVEGFIVFDFIDKQADFVRDMAGWIGAGAIKWEETVYDGLEKAPEAFIDLFKGANVGKMLVKLA